MATYRFPCPSCGKTLKVDDDLLARMSRSGRGTHCPRCKAPVRVGGPLASAALVSDYSDPDGQKGGVPSPTTPQNLPPPAPDTDLLFKCIAASVPVPPDLPPNPPSPARMTVCDTPPPDRRDTYGWDRTPDHAPIILAVLALLSVFWLFVCGGLARGPHWNGSPRTLESYQRYQESYDRLDREYARWGTSAAAVHGTVLLLSLLVSFVLVLASFCLWDRQGVPGRVLTITAGVFLLFPCFGVMLGIFGG